jgi:hypothetical protein
MENNFTAKFSKVFLSIVAFGLVVWAIERIGELIRGVPL